MLDVATGYSALRSLGTGVKDLFYLPAKAVVRKPRGLGRAMAAGGASFAKHTMLAAVRPAKQVAGALNRTTDRALAAMAMSTSSSAASQSGGRMILQGTTGLGMGVLQGAIGLVQEPYKGARKQGARGFAKGVGKGLVGAAIRPTSGVLNFAHRWAGALQQATGENETNSTHSARVGRARPPRMLHGERHRIALYSIAEALARHVLQSTEEGKYLHEPLLHCDLLGEEGRSETTVIVVLTEVRLLTVDATSWRMVLNLQLRRLHSVTREGHTLLLHLFARRRQHIDANHNGTALPSTAASPNGLSIGVAAADTRRLVCHSEETASEMLVNLQDTVASARARKKRIWHATAAAEEPVKSELEQEQRSPTRQRTPPKSKSEPKSPTGCACCQTPARIPALTPAQIAAL